MTNADATKAALQQFELDFKADLDEFNSLSAEVEDSDNLASLKAAADDGSTMELNYAKVSTDWAGIFGLPLTLTTSTGYGDWGAGDITGLGIVCLEDLGGADTTTSVGQQIAVGFMDDMVEASFAYTFDTENAVDFIAGVEVTASVVNAAVYMEGDYDAGIGQIGADVVVALDMGLSVDGSFIQTLETDVVAEASSAFGAGVAFSMDTLTAAVSFSGTNDDAFEYLAADAEYGITDMFTVAVASMFYLGSTSGVDTFQGLDAYVSIDATDNANFKVGYVLSDGYGADVSMNADGLADGGVYMTSSFNF
jgi:hypothetical protein